MFQSLKITKAVKDILINHGIISAPVLENNTTSPAKTSKVRDTSKLTQEDFDIIIKLYQEKVEYNMHVGSGERYSVEKLTSRLNEVLGKNKSSTVYGRVWRGVTKREDLPTREELTVI